MIQSKLQAQLSALLRGEDTSHSPHPNPTLPHSMMVSGEEARLPGDHKFSAEKLGLSLQGYSKGTPCKQTMGSLIPPQQEKGEVSLPG